MFVDTHAHLNMPPLYENWLDFTKLAVEAEVNKIIIPGVDQETNEKAVELAHKNPQLYASLGFHPETVRGTDDELPVISAQIEELSRLTVNERVVAIGEIGLDYFRLPTTKQAGKIVETQRAIFKQQLSLAYEANLPVIIHTRTNAAMNDALEDIKNVYGQHSFKGVFHCFTGTIGFFETIKDFGACVGVGGLITRSNQISLQEVISRIPLESIVLETDAPYLTPESTKHKFNQPAYVTMTALKLAEIFSASLSIIGETTTRNATRLFSRI